MIDRKEMLKGAVCCECGKELTIEEKEYNIQNSLSGYCIEHRKKF